MARRSEILVRNDVPAVTGGTAPCCRSNCSGSCVQTPTYQPAPVLVAMEGAPHASRAAVTPAAAEGCAPEIRPSCWLP